MTTGPVVAVMANGPVVVVVVVVVVLVVVVVVLVVVELVLEEVVGADVELELELDDVGSELSVVVVADGVAATRKLNNSGVNNAGPPRYRRCGEA